MGFFRSLPQQVRSYRELQSVEGFEGRDRAPLAAWRVIEGRRFPVRPGFLSQLQWGREGY
jgi:hypothetical protein